MVDGYNTFAGSQTDINRRLLRRIEALENAEAGEKRMLKTFKMLSVMNLLQILFLLESKH